MLSACIITLNEEKNLRACLESISFADEIVVVDAGSEDQTLPIAREFTNQVFQEPWKGFAAQKNSAIRKAKGPWILSIDADERVSPELRMEIEILLAGPAGLCAGYLIPRKNYFSGHWVRRCGWYPNYQLRLFLKDRGSFVPREVHEAVHVKGKTGKLTGHLEHLTYDSISDYLIRMEKYAVLSAREYHKNGKKAGWIKMSTRSAYTFFRMFFLRGGFLEGYRGFLLSVLYSQYTFLKYAKLKELWDKGADPR